MGIKEDVTQAFISAIERLVQKYIQQVMDLFPIEEIYTFSISTPAPEQQYINPLYVPDSGLWASLFQINNALTGLSITLLLLVAVATFVFTNMNVVSEYRGIGMTRIIGFGSALVIMNKFATGLGLNFSSTLARGIAPDSAEAVKFTIEAATAGALTGGLISTLLFLVILGTLILVMARYLLLALLFSVMPLLITGYFLKGGPLDTVSVTCERAIQTFVGLLLFPFPIAGVWLMATVFTDVNYFGSYFPGLAGDLIGVFVGTTILILGSYAAWKSTTIGQKAMGGTKKIGSIATQTGAAYATGGASLAATTALNAGNQRKAGKQLDTIEGYKKVGGTISDMNIPGNASARVDSASSWMSNKTSSVRQTIGSSGSGSVSTSNPAYEPSFANSDVEGQTSFATFQNPLESSVDYRETTDGQASLGEYDHIQQTTDTDDIEQTDTTTADDTPNTLGVPTANVLGEKLEDDEFNLDEVTYHHDTTGDPDSKLHQKGEFIDDNGHSIPYVSFKDPETGETKGPELKHGNQYDTENMTGRMYNKNNNKAHQNGTGEGEEYIQATPTDKTEITQKSQPGIGDFVEESNRDNMRLTTFEKSNKSDVSKLNDDELQDAVEHESVDKNKIEEQGIIGASFPTTNE